MALRRLQRTELVPVEFGSSHGLVPRPSLLGAIVAKAIAVEVDDLPDAQRLDLALLLSLVDDPVATSGELTVKDRRRLRARAEMADPDERAWASLNPMRPTEVAPPIASSSVDRALADLL